MRKILNFLKKYILMINIDKLISSINFIIPFFVYIIIQGKGILLLEVLLGIYIVILFGYMIFKLFFKK